ncbi:MAG TPA: hypothetical protein VHR86_06835 [Armatimonadota bacterium]|nr:hypothetical protein [Armatimonadota bacterium]
MDKVIVNVAGDEEKTHQLDPRVADIQHLKSALGQIIRESSRSEEEKAELHDRLHLTYTREKLLELWQEITGEQL